MLLARSWRVRGKLFNGGHASMAFRNSKRLQSLRLRSVLETHHEIVGVPDNNAVALRHLLAPGFNPQVENVMQVGSQAAVRSPPPAECLPWSPTIGLPPTLPPSTISGSSEECDGRPRGAGQTSSSIRGSSGQRTTRPIVLNRLKFGSPAWIRTSVHATTLSSGSHEPWFALGFAGDWEVCWVGGAKLPNWL